MKKFTALLLAFILMFSFAACGSEKSDDADKAEEQKGNSSGNKITFTEMVVVDNAECSIKITGIEVDDIWGYSLKTTVENKSSSKNYMFTVDNGAINGIECSPIFASDVAPGKKANDSISFAVEELEKNGITDFTDIELHFRVYDNNDWTAEDVVTEVVHVYPFGQEKATKFVRQSKSTDKVIFDNDKVTAIVTGYEKDEIWGYTANVYLVNKTNTRVMFSVDDSSVNGYMVDPFFANSVEAGKSEFVKITWSNDELENNNISKVNEIELTLRAYNDETWGSDDFANQKVTLNP